MFYTNDNDFIDFNTTKWTEGIYFIVIQNEGFKTTKKLIIQK